MAKTFFITAGEVSGDKLAANLIRAIKKDQPDATFIGITGPEMVAAGCQSFATIDDLSVMGLTETLKKLLFFIKLKRKIIRFVMHRKINAYIGVDFTEFNLSVEKALKRKGIKTCHYKSPTVWAWRKGRLKTIKKAVDKMLLLFPFEKAIYQEANIPAAYIGHPLADQIEIQSDRVAARKHLNLSFDNKVVAILPGSRGHEIDSLLPDLLKACELLTKHFDNVEFVLPIAAAKHRARIEKHVEAFSDLPIVLLDNQAHEAMLASDLVLLASGTAALEAMLLKRQMIVCYRLSKMTYNILLKLMYIKRYSLPNILAGRDIVPELIQDQVTPENIYQAALKELSRPSQEWLPEFSRIHESLRCDAAAQAARAVLEI